MAELLVVGWREWVALPDLGVPAIKVKVDTGARSSVLHAWDITEVERGGITNLRFAVRPMQHDDDTVVIAEAPLLEHRDVRSSNGETERRPVIETSVELLGRRFTIELTLSNRDQMDYRMLLGRRAVRRRFLVDAGRSFVGGRR